MRRLHAAATSLVVGWRVVEIVRRDELIRGDAEPTDQRPNLRERQCSLSVQDFPYALTRRSEYRLEVPGGLAEPVEVKLDGGNRVDLVVDAVVGMRALESFDQDGEQLEAVGVTALWLRVSARSRSISTSARR